MICARREGIRACCAATDRLIESGMTNSTLLIPLVIIGLVLKVLGASAPHSSDGTNDMETTDLALSSALTLEGFGSD